MAGTSSAAPITVCGMFTSAESILRRARNEWEEAGGGLATAEELSALYNARIEDVHKSVDYWLDWGDAQVSPSDRDEVRHALAEAVAAIVFPFGARPFAYSADRLAWRIGKLSTHSVGTVGLAQETLPLPNGTRPDGTVYIALQMWVAERMAE